MNVLVTGGYGFLGGHVVDELKRRGHTVDVPSHEDYDLTRSRDTYLMFEERGEPDVIVHAAAAVGGIGANVAEPGRFFHDNLAMGMHILEWARILEIPKVVSIGTACMYPADATTLKEPELWNGHPAPATAPYAFAKRAVLEMGQAYRTEYGLDAVMVIPTNLFGPRDNFNRETGHVIPAMISKFIEAAEIDPNEDVTLTLWGTGKPTRDFLFVKDAARGIVDAVESYDGADPVNLGTGIDYSIKEVAERIKLLTGFEGKIVWDESKPDGTPRRRLDPSFAAEALGWVASTALGDGLRETIDWYRSQR